MSTRAVYTFIDAQEIFHIYKHGDGYPTGAAEAITKALDYAWELPRFEVDAFAAAFVCGNKESTKDRARRYREQAEAEQDPERKRALLSFAERWADPNSGYRSSLGGDIRLLPTAPDWKEVAPCDIAYRYEVRCMDGELLVKCYAVDGPSDYLGKEDWTEVELFSGTLKRFTAWAKWEEEKEKRAQEREQARGAKRAKKEATETAKQGIGLRRVAGPGRAPVGAQSDGWTVI